MFIIYLSTFFGKSSVSPSTLFRFASNDACSVSCSTILLDFLASQLNGIECNKQSRKKNYDKVLIELVKRVHSACGCVLCASSK